MEEELEKLERQHNAEMEGLQNTITGMVILNLISFGAFALFGIPTIF
jgi:hypothetical protein